MSKISGLNYASVGTGATNLWKNLKGLATQQF